MSLDQMAVIRTQLDEMLQPRRVRQGLSNGAQRGLRSQTGTSTGRAGCVVGQMVNLRGEGGEQQEQNKYSQWTVKVTVFNLLSRMQAVVLILISTCLLRMDLIPSVKFLAHNTGLGSSYHNWKEG